MRKKLLSLLPIAAIIIFAFFLRFWMINSVAPGISIDELEYTITAKSYYLTGKDLVNATNPLDVLRFVYPPTDAIKAELPYLFEMPFVGPFAFSLPLARLPFVLFSLGTVWLIYAIAKEIFDRKIGLMAALLGTINPFLVLTGRTMYEIVPATFFYFFGMYILMKGKGMKILFAIPVFVCAFYAYIGTKLLFLPFVLLTSLFAYFYLQKKKNRKYYLVVSIFALLFVLFYVGMLHINSSGTRLGELLTPNSPQIAKVVDEARKNSIASPLTPLIFNKGTMYLKAIIDSLFINFSSGALFIYSDGFFRLYNFGVLYYVDGIFILSGLVFLFSKKIKLGVFLLAYILVAMIPQILHTSADTAPSYTHTVLLFPFLLIIAAAGIQYLLSIINGKSLQRIVGGVIVLLYAASTIIFFQIYFYQYPLVGKDDFPSRLMANYITLANKENKSVLVMSPDASEKFKKYLFYANAMTPNTIHDVKQAFFSNNRRLGHVSFTSCPGNKGIPKNMIVIEDGLCGDKDFMQREMIPFIKDGGTAYKIYQDSICSSYGLKQYPSDLTLNLFQVEKLSKKQFCETFITR